MNSFLKNRAKLQLDPYVPKNKLPTNNTNESKVEKSKEKNKEEEEDDDEYKVHILTGMTFVKEDTTTSDDSEEDETFNIGEKLKNGDKKGEEGKEKNKVESQKMVENKGENNEKMGINKEENKSGSDKKEESKISNGTDTKLGLRNWAKAKEKMQPYVSKYTLPLKKEEKKEEEDVNDTDSSSTGEAFHNQVVKMDKSPGTSLSIYPPKRENSNNDYSDLGITIVNDDTKKDKLDNKMDNKMDKDNKEKSKKPLLSEETSSSGSTDYNLTDNKKNINQMEKK